jgi:regulator of cell morphogenesis and NO signaling
MNINTHSVIGDIVANNYKTAEVFRSYGIDFCCKGNRSLMDLSASRKINLDRLIEDLNQNMGNSSSSAPDFQSWPLDQLADYIESKYHRYIEETIPILAEYLTKVCKVHGHGYPELHKIQEIFTESSSDLLYHMSKEEKILFPAIRNMISNLNHGLPFRPPMFGSVRNPIHVMMEEHTTEGGRYSEIAMLTNGFSPPPNACNTFIVTYAMLKEFEEKLHEHIHLENNILFPGAIKYEDNMTNHPN